MNVWWGLGILIAVICLWCVVYMYRSAELKSENYEYWPQKNIKGGEANEA